MDKITSIRTASICCNHLTFVHHCINSLRQNFCLNHRTLLTNIILTRPTIIKIILPSNATSPTYITLRQSIPWIMPDPTPNEITKMPLITIDIHPFKIDAPFIFNMIDFNLLFEYQFLNRLKAFMSFLGTTAVFMVTSFTF